MKYVNANQVLPKELITELQKYIQGETLYIPKPKAMHQEWGTCSGERKRINERNREIKQRYKNGQSIDQLADLYFLSPETIKKLVYVKE
ncbi:CD3324 family protein [Thalassobacillus sp. CUG 92003]|uniref:CD3324 family protein n=1 Tax=Thalassobacillus sp. CUG 92003 TaxID=2736641 RepID=UPI0015E70817|nr:CD3324 family protein [Thalassobacillus sp. CUG 92003]